MSEKISLQEEKNNNFYLRIITIISVLIPIVVTVLFFGLSKSFTKINGLDVTLLPHINAILNASTFACLVLGGVAIKQKNIKIHRIFMMTAFVLSSIFLVSYVIYHNNAESTKFGGEGIIKIIYLFILITHIILATLVVPFVLTAIYFAWTNQIQRHKKIVKWTYPIWTYVAASGVVVYLMISPYYIS